MQSVGLFEAWGLWWQGKSLQGMSLWGVPILFLGRVGKIMSFVGSVVVVIDIIGPARIREWGSRTKRRDVEVPILLTTTAIFLVASSVMVVLAGFGLIVELILLLAGFSWREPFQAAIGSAISIPGFVSNASFLICILLPGLAQPAVRRIGKALESQRWEYVVRWWAFFLVVFGFSLDLLAS